MALIHRFDPPANKQLIPVQDRIPNTVKGTLGTVQRERKQHKTHFIKSNAV